MNKSYRVIWNYALQCYVVTSELARGKIKSSCSGKAASKSRLVGGVLGSALLLAGSPAALAANGATVDGPAETLEFSNQTLQATDNDHYGLLVQNGGKASATDVTVLNDGNNGYGVFSTLASSATEMTRGSVQTTGTGGYGVVASLTGTLKLDGTRVETTGKTAYGAYASSAGIINSLNADYVTHGDGAYNVYSRGTGSLIDITGGSVTTSGTKAYGLVAGSGGRLIASDVTVITQGNDSSGVFSNLASTEVTLQGGTVTTSGTKAHGLVAASGGKLSASGVQVTTSGNQSNGVTANNAGTVVTLTGGTYSTSGETAHGIYTGNAATLRAGGVQVTTTGMGGHGGFVNGEGSVLNVDNSAFVVSGAGANGLNANDKSTLNASNSEINVTGSGTGVVANSTGTVLNLSDSRINIGQGGGYAAYSYDSSTVNLKNVNIVTDADNEALVSAFSGDINAENVSVEAHGGGSGIRVQDGSTLTGKNITMAKSGIDNDGFNAAISVQSVYDPDLINHVHLTDSAINVTGENATGILSKWQATLADIKLANTRIAATDGAAVNVLTGTSMNIDADNSVLSGSTLLKTGYNTAEGSTAGSVVLNGSNRSLFEGNVDIDRSQTTDSQINLSGSSAWTGASSGLNTLTLSDNSQWNITGDSSVNTLSASNSTLNFTHDGDGFSTLTVNGNYSGDNSTLVMNAALGDDHSASDKLHILGDSSGSTDVVVNNAGGSGAQTIQGLQLIQVDGASNGEFRQKGRIVAGAYDYNLVKGADQHGWYLVSDKNGSEPDPVVTPGEGEGGQIVEPPVDQHNMIVRPEAASYSANLAAANTLFTTSMDDRPAETFYTDANGRQQSTRLWLHNSAGHSRVKDSSGQLKSDTNRYAIQLGGDVAGGTLTGSDSLRLGAMAGYGNAQSKSRSAVSGYQSRGQVNGYSLGVYGRWQQNAAEQSGAFVDSSLSYGWFNNSVKGDDIGQQSYKSKGISASLAGGYRAEVATLSDSTSLWLRPQAQLNWQGVKADDVKEQNGSRVQGTGQDNLQSRLGVRASLRTLLDPQSHSAIEPYAEANWLHNSRAFGTALNGVNIQQAGTRNAAEVKLGVDARLNANVNLWGGVAQQLGNHSYSDTSAVAGVKVSF
ncbi:autotransporter outer membrane beta-barrel domain-containing protein (plasmid) [Pantoea dispersa]|uniref:autotransporter outer membrane beta-barrel domain-containing protein n=1 Tax=Pantoea dispersa TaxID=59814 RepID=UPI001CA79F85|nr:autotransporter outer membrane beta-barrel domain-containing protein [Pantoea dispersa]QZY92799.1 autotransporter outer membrane beta-barrel domain-containing protein [Pantoea dispersa]